MPSRVGLFLINSGRSVFLASIVFSAAAYGLTRASTINVFNWVMLACFLLWSSGHLFCRRLPKLNPVSVLFALLILVYGWAITYLGAIQDRVQEQASSPQWLLDAVLDYGAYYPDCALTAMFRTTVLLCAFLIAQDCFASPSWSRGLILTMTGTATAMVVFFFFQKLTGKALLLRSEVGDVFLSFVTYRYWGNAAAFLNLFWPVIAAVALLGSIARIKGWSIWMVLAVLIFSALYINVSKAGHGLGIVGIILFLVLASVVLAKSGYNLKRVFSLRIAIPATLATIALGLILFSAIRWERWQSLEDNGLNNDRLIAYSIFLKILPDSGWTGFGPGGFDKGHYSYMEDDPRISGYPYWVAHEDYLQTLIEWGYVGTLLWALFLIPPFLFLLIGCFHPTAFSLKAKRSDYAFTLQEKFEKWFRELPAGAHPLLRAGAFTSLSLTALHSLVDFPMQIESLQFYFLIWLSLGWAPSSKQSAGSSENSL